MVLYRQQRRSFARVRRLSPIKVQAFCRPCRGGPSRKCIAGHFAHQPNAEEAHKVRRPQKLHKWLSTALLGKHTFAHFSSCKESRYFWGTSTPSKMGGPRGGRECPCMGDTDIPETLKQETLPKAQASCLCETYPQKPRAGRDLKLPSPPCPIGVSWPETREKHPRNNKNTFWESQNLKNKQKKVLKYKVGSSLPRVVFLFVCLFSTCLLLVFVLVFSLYICGMLLSFDKTLCASLSLT